MNLFANPVFVAYICITKKQTTNQKHCYMETPEKSIYLSAIEILVENLNGIFKNSYLNTKNVNVRFEFETANLNYKTEDFNANRISALYLYQDDNRDRLILTKSTVSETHAIEDHYKSFYHELIKYLLLSEDCDYKTVLGEVKKTRTIKSLLNGN